MGIVTSVHLVTFVKRHTRILLELRLYIIIVFSQYIQDIDKVNMAFFLFQRKTSPHHIFSKVGDAKALWSNKFEAYAAKQASNPFSDKYVGPAKIDKNDPNYGR